MPPILFPLRTVPFQATRSRGQLASPRLVRGALPLPAVFLRVYGVTKDSTGAVLGGATVHLFRTSDDLEMDQTTSDAEGYYEFRSASPSLGQYVVAYKVGSPDVAGTTINTLVGA